MRRLALAAAIAVVAGAVALAQEDELAKLAKLAAAADAQLASGAYEKAGLAYVAYLKELGPAKIAEAEKRTQAQRGAIKLGCCLSECGKTAEAVEAVAIAVKEGYTDWAALDAEPHLAAARATPAWKKLAPAVSPEILEEGFYRAAGGYAILHLPDTHGWTIEHQPGRIFLFLGTRQKNAAVLDLALFTESQFAKQALEGEALAKAIAGATLDETKKAHPYFEPVGAGEAQTFAGGAGHHHSFSGTSPNGLLSGTVTAIANGKLGMVLTVIQAAASKDAPLFAKKLLDSVRLGPTIPRLPAHDPGVALEGVFQGPYELDFHNNGTQYAYVFDRRGYATEEIPWSDRSADLEALYQASPGNVSAYTVANGRIELRATKGKPWSYPIKVNGRRLTIDGRDYDRIDGCKTDGLTLDGHYNSFSVTNSGFGEFASSASSTTDYWFTAAGRFSTKSESGVRSQTPGTSLTGGSETATTRGTYRIAGDRIVFAFDSGAKVTSTFYPGNPESPEKFGRGSFFIGGSFFWKK